MCAKKRSVKAICLLLVVAVALVSPLGALKAVAAAKAKLSAKSATVAIDAKVAVPLKNKVKGAKYSFKTSKPRVAIVNPSGKVTGKEAGKSKITVEQTVKGKTTKVGAFTVTVAKCKVEESSEDLFVGDTLTWKELKADYLSYTIAKAKYVLSSSDGSVVKVSKTGTITAVGGGEATVTVKETYNKKTRTVGKISIYVEEEEEEEYEEEYEDEEYEDETQEEEYEETFE